MKKSKKATRESSVSPVQDVEIETVTGHKELMQAEIESMELRERGVRMVDQGTEVERSIITQEIGINHNTPMVSRYAGLSSRIADRVSEIGVQAGKCRGESEAG